jgi:lysine/ornithine N-monooxygenase
MYNNKGEKIMSEALEETTVQEEKFDAKAIEQEMIDIAENRAQDPSETAAMVYHMYRPEFIKRVTTLSSRAKSRLIAMLVQYPLNGTDIKFSSELEKECYFFADSMIQAKFVLMMDSYKDAAQEMVNAQDEFIFNKEEAEKLNKEGE